SLQGDWSSDVCSSDLVALKAEGYAIALNNINEAAQRLDARTMGLQYLDALKEIGAYPSTKFVLPLELTGLLRGLTGQTDQAFGEIGRASCRERAYSSE